jgi:alpha-L-fucosidase
MKNIFLSVAMLLCAANLSAQKMSDFAEFEYTPTEANLKARSQFQDNKFGIFIHWGIYSMLANGEWALETEKLNAEEYAKLAKGFYPSMFNAHDWVADIKSSGAKYITITSRHHDGFSMFNTEYSDFNIIKASPFGRDILKELADECHKQGITLNFYYSLLDWTRLDYPLGESGRNNGRQTDEQDYDAYLQFMKNQLTELLTNYGPIGCIWFDGWWDHKRDAKPFDWRLRELYTLIHKLQPSCLVADNHHITPFSGEDIQVFERDLPGENHGGYSKGQKVSEALPLETCNTMNGMWGYKIKDLNYKTAKQLVQYVVRAAGKNANLLMNIGPQPDGELPDSAIVRLYEMGSWFKVYGPTIYGTRGGMVAPHDWGVTTQKGKTLYVHILNSSDKSLFLPMKANVSKAKVFKNNAPVAFKRIADGVLLTLNEVPTDVDYVVELTLK